MVLVFGSINVDLVVPVPRLPQPGETILGGSYELLPGGKGANQAMAAVRAGAAVTLVGAVGADAFAAIALGSCATKGWIQIWSVPSDFLRAARQLWFLRQARIRSR